MANATQIVTAWIDAILKGPVAGGARYLSAKLDWQENGLPYAEACKAHPRPKWTGILHDGVDLKPKLVARAGQPVVVSFGEVSLTRTKVSGDAKSVIMEFSVTHKGQTSKFSGHFTVSGSRIVSAHWFGNPAAFAQLVQCSCAA
jgi:hypothetical protein